ncbi:MAG TPA: flagellar biosynthesis anti-sigma factor FlgM [Acidobacteriota bacterium]|nr:flagellar biosynthesis anti-sigma factor FlgM [Acidobacteriota bacterium]HRR56727.1 flagellar biosynthesis anti-sigma factor FlgM [Acidobacteriota bacterium]HRV07940.1 flagellar biosynthesis anti-sigma factor FlgM [Acidobacteriota bacterium]
MKIDGNNPILRPELLNPQDQNTQSPRAGEQKEAGVRIPRDRVELSVSGRELEQLARKVAEAPEVRAQRIEQLKASIEAGTYNVKAEEIAEAIITGSLLDRTV